MKTNNLAVITALSLFASTSASAITFDAATTVAGVKNIQGPATTGTVTSYQTDPDGSDFTWEGPAAARASADDAGRAAVSAEGLFACGSCNFELMSETNSQISYTNDSAGSVGFSYNFFINGPRVEVQDYANVDENSGLTAEAGTDISMMIDGIAMDNFFSGLLLEGGDKSHAIDAIGGTATPFTTGGGFGYFLNDTFGLFEGTLSPGETVTIDTYMYAYIAGPGWEVGAKASIGDPNDLTLSPGSSGNFVVSAVPVPAAVWLFGSGLIGLVGMARRKS